MPNQIIRRLLGSVLAIVCLWCQSAASADWLKTYGTPGSDQLSSMERTNDGGYILAGSTNVGGNYDAWVVKLSATGDVQWQKTFGGPNGDSARAIQQTRDGGYIVAGSTASFAAQSGDPGDGWVFKLDQAGTLQWQKIYGTADWDFLSSIIETTDGHYVAAGTSWGVDATAYADAWVLKLNASGNVVWERTYGMQGGGKHDTASLVLQTSPDSGFLVVGDTYSAGNGFNDVWVLKLDPSGNVSWSKTYGSANNDSAFSAKQVSSGGYIVAGYTKGPDNIHAAWLLRLDSSGDIQFQKRFSIAGTHVVARSIDEAAGSIFVGGYAFTSSVGAPPTERAWIAAVDSSGKLQWAKAVAVNEEYYSSLSSARISQDSGYIAMGLYGPWVTTNGFSTIYDYDVWVLKVDVAGDLPGCSKLYDLGLSAADTSVAPANFSITAQQAINSLGANSSATSALTDVSVTLECTDAGRICRGPLNFPRWPSWRDFLRICIAWPSGVGIGIPTRCPPLQGCPQCAYAFSKMNEGKELPPQVTTLFAEMTPLFASWDDQAVPRRSAAHIRNTLAGIPSGRYFDAEVKQRILGQLEKGDASETRGYIAEALNAIELDLGVPTLPKPQVIKEGSSTVDLAGVAKLEFRGVEKGGGLTLSVRPGLPALPEGFAAGWPLAHYELEFAGRMRKGGHIDIGIFVGGVVFRDRSQLRLLEWNGRYFRDVTTGYDSKNGLLVGRTSRLAKYVVASPTKKLPLACN